MRIRPPRRTIKDYLLPFLIIIAGGALIMLLFKVVPQIMNGEEEINLGRSGSAELSVVSGEVEAYLPAVEAWKIISETASLSNGESVRTSADGEATIEFDDGTMLTLGNSSKIKIAELYNSLTKKTISLELEEGSAGVLASSTSDSDFSIKTNLIKTYKADGKFFIQAGEKEHSVSAVTGGFASKILDPKQEKELPSYVVEEGRTLTISERRITLLKIGGEIELIKPTPSEIQSSKLYITLSGETATDPETPEVASSDDDKTEETETSTEDDTKDEATEIADTESLSAPIVTTGNGNITATKDPISVSGTASAAASKIEITPKGGSPYVLGQFVAGSGKWKYNVAEEYGNLKPGTNIYEVLAIDAEGKRSPVTSFMIYYKSSESVEEETASLPKTPVELNTDTTSGVPPVGDSTFAPPTVSEPEDGAKFTSEPIHFEGTVPAGTVKVLINEYELSRFEAGDTTWVYNAKVEYENLEKGENEYEIEAVSESGERSSVTIKITYEPEE